MRTVGQVIAGTPELSTEVGLSRDLPATVTALMHGEIDAGFGRVHSLASELLSTRLARVEPVDAVLSAGHPLARQPEARPADLRDSILWCPASLDRLDFLRHFAGQFGIEVEEGGANLGLDHLIDRIRAEPRRFSLLPADIPLPDSAGICSVPICDPTPLYAWSLIWRSQDQHPMLGVLLQRFAETGNRQRWLEYDPARDWLPHHDHAELTRLSYTPNHRQG
jgi:DNA-binding transcriptional LysR family regulator